MRQHNELTTSFSHALTPNRIQKRVNIAKDAPYDSHIESFTIGKM